MKCNDNDAFQGGVFIHEIHAGGAAEKTGALHHGDLVTKVMIGMKNKLPKARKMRKPPGTLGLKKFGPGKFWVENVWTQNTCILAYMQTFILISGNLTETKYIS